MQTNSSSNQRWTPLAVGLMSLLVLNTIGVLAPLAIAVLSAFKSTMEIASAPFGLPAQLDFVNFRDVLADGQFGTYLRNSLFVTIVSEVMIVMLSAMGGYCLGRFSFRGNNALYVMFLMGLMIPAKLLLVPLFIQLKAMGLLDSLWGLCLVYAAGGIPAGVFIMTGFFRALPKALESAARIDGASEWILFWKIMLPLVRPQLAIVTIYTAIPIWNDFLLPVVFLSTPDKKTIPQGLAVFFGEHAVNMGALFAGLTLAALPLVLLYLVLSEQFIKGLTAGAVKG
jgi:raffinose/stachyose/melibiose transport system permease protein